MAGAGVGDIFIIQDRAEKGAFPLEGVFGPCAEGVIYIIAVLFWFGDAQSAAVLQG